MIPGIDVSSNNGVIDWPTCAAALLAQSQAAFVAVKVNEYDYVNPLLHQQRQGAHAAGIRYVMLYDYGRPDLCSGADEADRYLAAIGADGGILRNEIVCLDLEQDNGIDPAADLRAYVADWIGRVQRALGVPVVVYSGDYYLRPHALYQPPTPLSDTRVVLWLAAPDVASPPTAPVGHVLIWQAGWHGKVAGINGDVDIDYFLGSEGDLQALGWGNQPDPVAGKPAVGIADIDGDAPTIIKHAIDLLTNNPTPPLDVIRADLSLALTKFGLLP